MGQKLSISDLRALLDSGPGRGKLEGCVRLPLDAKPGQGGTSALCQFLNDEVVIKVLRKDSPRPALFSPKPPVDKSDRKAVTLIEYLDDLLGLQVAKTLSLEEKDKDGKPINRTISRQVSVGGTADDKSAQADSMGNVTARALVVESELERLYRMHQRPDADLSDLDPIFDFQSNAGSALVDSSASGFRALSPEPIAEDGSSKRSFADATGSAFSDGLRSSIGDFAVVSARGSRSLRSGSFISGSSSIAPTAAASSSAGAHSHMEDFLKRFIELLYEGTSSRLDAEHKRVVSFTPRHTNLLEIKRVMESPEAFFVVVKYFPSNLQNALRFTPEAVVKEEMKMFLIYQLLHTIRFCHERGVVHGNLTPAKLLLLPNTMWMYLTGFECPAALKPFPARTEKSEAADEAESMLMQWVDGKISNFDYIMELNRLAGRSPENASYHPVMPWVVDFTSPSGGYRDLTRTKFRLQKGDEQLDFTYNNSTNPHHITETLSEITYYVYMARRTPLDVLKRVVRQNFVPNEYPRSMERMFKWTPDECIPAFFADGTIFGSIHKEIGLNDLEIPPWCANPEDFVRWHRECLESEQVSRDLHLWIDLTFGYKLSGKAAIKAKNVPLATKENPILGKKGVVQLFDQPHPPRKMFGSQLIERLEPSLTDVDMKRGDFDTLERKGGIPISAATSATNTPGSSVASTPAPSVPNTPLTGSPSLSTLSLTSSQSGAIGGPPGGPNTGAAVPPLVHQQSFSTSSLNNPAVSGVTMSCLDPLKMFEQSKLFDSRHPFQEGSYVPYQWKDTSEDADDDDWLGKDSKDEPRDEAKLRAELEAADMFAVGCIIAEIFRRRPLFNRRTLDLYQEGRLTPDLSVLPHPVRTIVANLLNLTPSKRMSAQAVLTSSSSLFHHYAFLYRFLSAFEKKKATHPVRAASRQTRTHSGLSLPGSSQQAIASSLSGAFVSIATKDSAAAASGKQTATPDRSQARADSPIVSLASPAASNAGGGVVNLLSSPLSPASSDATDDASTDTSTPSKPAQPQPPAASALSIALSSPSAMSPRSPRRFTHAHRPSDAELFASFSEPITPQADAAPHVVLSPANKRSALAAGADDRNSSSPSALNAQPAPTAAQQTVSALQLPSPRIDAGSDSPLSRSSSQTLLSPSSHATQSTSRQEAARAKGLDPLCAWLINKLPALCVIPTKIFLLAVPFCTEICLQSERSIHCLPAFGIIGRKLGRALSEVQLKPVLQQLLHRLDDVQLQCEMLKLPFLRTVRQCFMYSQFFQDFMEHMRNSLLASNPLIAATASNTLVEFCDFDLRREVDEEVLVNIIVLPLVARLGKPGSQPVLTTLINIAKICNPMVITNVILPNAVQLIQRGTGFKGQDGGVVKGRELDLNLLNGLSLLYDILPDLALESIQPLLLESATLKTLLTAPPRGPLSVQCLRKLLQVIIYLLVEIGMPAGAPSPPPKGKQAAQLPSKQSQLILPIVPIAADFLSGLVQRLDSDSNARFPYDPAACREFICMMYISLTKLLGHTSVRKGMTHNDRVMPQPLSDRLDAIVKETAKTRPMDQEVEKARRHSETGKGRNWVRRNVRFDDEDGLTESRSGRLQDLDSSLDDDDAGSSAVGRSVDDNRVLDERKEAKRRELRDKQASAKKVSQTMKPSDVEAFQAQQQQLNATPRKDTAGANADLQSPSADQKAAAANATGGFFSSALFALADGGAASASASQSFPMDLSELIVTSSNAPLKTTWKLNAEVKHSIRVHSSSILAVDPHPEMGLFVTAGADKLVKVLSIGLGSNALHNPMTYKGHKQPVFDVRLLTGDFGHLPQHVASCDNTIHVWDLETGQALSNLLQFKPEPASTFAVPFGGGTARPVQRTVPETPLCFQYVPSRESLVVGTTQASLRFLDLKSGQISRAWRHTGNQQAIAGVRAIAVCDTHWIASGLTSGEVTLFDERTGIILSQWRAHESQVLKIVPYGSHFVLTSGADKTICLWDVRGSEPYLHQKFTGLPDSVKSLELHRQDFVCAVGNKIGLGSLKKASQKHVSKLSVTALKGHKTKSNLSALAILPSYRFLLMGTEDGRVLVSG